MGVDSVEARAQAPLTLVRERLGDEELGGGSGQFGEHETGGGLTANEKMESHGRQICDF